MKEIIIVKAGGSNFASVEDAFERMGCKVFYAQNNRDITNASKLLIPGVGSMANVNVEEIRETVKCLTQPVLGICLGMQMLFEKSQESPNTKALGVIDGEVLKFEDDVISPHTGWNELMFTMKSGIFSTMKSGYVYFTHSYYAPLGKYTKGYCEYGNYKVSAIVQKENFYGFQFHPERSGLYGEKLLQKFIEEA